MMWSQVRTMVKPGCSREILKAAISSMVSVTDVLTVMSHPLNAELPLYHFKLHIFNIMNAWFMYFLCHFDFTNTLCFMFYNFHVMHFIFT